jgi:hypothetical protein
MPDSFFPHGRTRNLLDAFGFTHFLAKCHA